MTPPLKLGVLLSGRGSNFHAILKNCLSQKLNAEISVVISNNGNAKGLQIAAQHNIPAIHVDPTAYPSRDAYESEIRSHLHAHQVQLVILAGYMKLLGTPLLDAYPMKIMNIHPSLLPSFKGLNAQKQALDYGVKISGCTVHFGSEYNLSAHLEPK